MLSVHIESDMARPGIEPGVKSNNPKGLSESSSEHNCCLFIDIKTYLSPAVSTTVKGVHTAGLLHLHTDYINSHIVTESKKRTTS